MTYECRANFHDFLGEFQNGGFPISAARLIQPEKEIVPSSGDTPQLAGERALKIPFQCCEFVARVHDVLT